MGSRVFSAIFILVLGTSYSLLKVCLELNLPSLCLEFTPTSTQMYAHYKSSHRLRMGLKENHGQRVRLPLQFFVILITAVTLF